MSRAATVDETAYRPPIGAHPPATDLGVSPWECLRVGVTVATVYVYPWSERPGTVFAHVERGGGALERAHLSPESVRALLEVAPIVEKTALLTAPAWPSIDGPTPSVG